MCNGCKIFHAEIEACRAAVAHMEACAAYNLGEKCAVCDELNSKVEDLRGFSEAFVESQKAV